MTMPDLHNYQIKRSSHKVHYVYVQHSLVVFIAFIDMAHLIIMILFVQRELIMLMK